MRLLRSLLLLLTLAFFYQSANGQLPPGADPAKWRYEVRKKGDNKYQLIIHLGLVKDWHIYSFKPGGDGSLLPPKFTFDKNGAVKLKGSVRESGKLITKTLTGIDGAVNFYKENVTYIQDLAVTGNTTITGNTDYMVCNDQLCLPPKNIPFSFEIRDAVAATVPAAESVIPVTVIDTGLTAGVPGGKSIAPSGKMPASDTSHALHGQPAKPKIRPTAFAMFISGFGNGLLAVITPCVFAMLPMTVSFFLKRSKDRKTGVRIAIPGILCQSFSYSPLSAGLFQPFSEPMRCMLFLLTGLLTLVFFAVFLAFGISFLGAFEINLPSSWATRMDSKANTRNFLGIFFMALTLVIVSFSCTVPFIGNMVVMIQTGGKIAPLLGFFGFGVGLALPFTLFALFPSLLNELGKSGGWLNVVKVTFGFIELALAMKFLSNADLQRGWRLLDREIFIAIWMGLSFVLGFYLLGFIRFSHDSEMPKNDWGLSYLKVPRLFFALIAVIFGLYLLPGMWGAPLNGMGAFIPPMGTIDFNLAAIHAAAPAGTAATDGSRPVKYVDKMKIFEPPSVINFNLTTFYDYKEALAASKIAKKPVFLDFTGINCANCRKLEAEVWSKPDVLDRMRNDFIVASLFCDVQAIQLPPEEQHYSKVIGSSVKSLGDANVELQATKFGTAGQPMYYFVDENGTILEEKPIGYPISPENFVAALERVKARYKQLHP